MQLAAKTVVLLFCLGIVLPVKAHSKRFKINQNPTFLNQDATSVNTYKNHFSNEALPSIWTESSNKNSFLLKGISFEGKTIFSWNKLPSSNIAIVSDAIPDVRGLVKSLKKTMDVYIVHSGNGWTNVADALSKRHGIDAIHIFSHGSNGAVMLGSSVLNRNSLSDHTRDLHTIGAALNSDGKILIYGCDVAQQADGQAFVRDIAAITGADVAASKDLSGPVKDGGNWTLEFATNTINATVPLDALSEYGHFLPSGTITASGGTAGDDFGTVFSDGATSTGSATSNDIAGITIDASYTPTGTTSSYDILFAPAGTQFSSKPWPNAPLSQDYLVDKDQANNGEQNLTIKSASGTNFSFEQIHLSDYAGYETSASNTIKITAYRDGSTVGSTTFKFTGGDNYERVINQGDELTTSTFDNVDKVVLSDAFGGVITLGFNNITIGDPVLPNTAPTDISLSSTSVGQSGGVNATVGTLSSTDVDAGDTHTYSLVTGTGDGDNGNFNISGSSLRANDASSLAAGNYSVRIQTDDGNGGLYQKAFTITVNDDLAPSYQNSTPSVSGTSVSQTTLTIRLNEIGTAFYVVVPDGDGAPSSTQVKLGQDSGGSAALASGSLSITSAGQDFTDDITGLSPGTAYDIYVVAEDDEGTPNLQSSATLVNVTTDAPDSDGNLTSAGTVTEPVGLGSTHDTMGEAVDIFDFTLSDGGTSDGLPMQISQIKVNVSGTSTDAERGQVTWRLNGPDASNVTGTYNAGSDVITFSGLNISIADGNATGETYTINAYYNDNTGLTDNHTFILSVDGDTDLSLSGSGTQVGSTSAVTNGSGSTIDITATKLVFIQQPIGSVSGSAFITQPKVAAQDDFGNTDMDFGETVTLTESSAGSLSGDTDVAAVNGVATFNNVAYTATADQQNVTLTANDEDGTGTDLSTVDSNPVTSDVVATKLVFSTQPAPVSFRSGETVSFTTIPVVNAMDANNIVDTGYSTDISLSLTDPNDGTLDGTVNSMTGTGDTDGSAITVTLAPSSGKVTFNSLALQYTNAGSSDETVALRATSGGLTSANSTSLTATVNNVPTLDLDTGTGGSGVTVSFTENADQGTAPADGVAVTGLVNAADNDGTVNSATLTLTNPQGDTGEGLSIDTSTLASALGFSTTSNKITITRNSASNAELVTAIEAVRFQDASDSPNETNRTISVQIMDNEGASANATAIVTVQAQNDPPTISGYPATTVKQDASYSFTPSASDPDVGDTKTFSISNKPSWANFNTSTGQLSGTPGNADVGTYAAITITVADASDATDTLGPFSIDVINTNDVPTDISLSSNSVNQSGGANATVGTFSTTDVDAGDTHTYSLVPGSGDTDNGSFNINNGTLQAKDASVLISGDYSVRIQTDDGNGGTYQKAFTITVVDDVAPGFANSTPTVSGTTIFQTTLTVCLDEIGTAYYVVVPDGDGAPGSAQVKAGQDSGGSAALASGSVSISSAGQDFTDTITGLSPGTAYNIYVVAQDDEGTPNLQGSATRIDVTTNSPSLTTSTITASPNSITANGSSTSSITVQLKDANGNNLVSDAGTVTLATDVGSIGSVSYQSNGSYKATFTSSTTAGTATITGKLDGAGLSDKANVTLTSGAVDRHHITIQANPANMPADGSSTSTITVQMKDQYGNNYPAGGATIQLATTQGSVESLATDNSDGTYTATFTASTTNGTAIVSGTYNGLDIDSTAKITLTNTAPFAGLGNALNFDGNDDYIDLGNSQIIGGDDTFTIEAWVRPADVSGTQSVYGEFVSSESNTRNYLKINNGVVQFDQWPPSGTTIQGGSLTDGQWTHITYVRNGSSQAIYVNGTKVASNNNAETYSDTTPNQIAIGRRLGSASGDAFNGSIDELRIWGSARTASQIANDWNEAIDPTNKDLLAYYDFNEPAGNTQLTDRTGNGPNGTLTNMDASTDWVASKKTMEYELPEDKTNGYTITSAFGYDNEGNGLSYSITSGNTNNVFAINSSTGAITVNDASQLDYETLNTYTLNIHVSDGSLSDDYKIAVDVTNVNEAPVLTANNPALTAITEKDTTNNGQLISSIIGSSITDVDNGAVQGIALVKLNSGNGNWQYSTDGGTTWNDVNNISNTNALLLGASDKLRFLPNGQDGTTASVTYRAWDQSTGSAGAKVDASTNGGATAFSTGMDTGTITVTAENDAPTITSISDQTIKEDATTGALAFSINDVDNALSSLTIKATSSNQSLLPDDSLQVSGGGANRTIEAAPVANGDGLATITLAVSDGDKTTTTSFTITVTAVNDSPVVDAGIPDQTATENVQFTFTIPSDAFSDPDPNDKLALTVTNLPDGLSFDPTSNTISGVPTASGTGENTVSVTAADPSQATASTSFKLTVKAQVPATVVITKPGDGSKDVVLKPTFRWNKASGAQNYELEIATSGAFAQNNLVLDEKGIKQESYQPKDTLDHRTTFYWRVRGMNGSVSGDWSKVFSFTTIPEAPNPVVLTTPGDSAGSVDSQVTLTWEVALRAEHYQLQISEDEHFQQLVTDQQVTGTSLTLQDKLNDNTTFYWRVRAENGGGNGSWSPVWNFTTNATAPELSFPGGGEEGISIAPQLYWTSAYTGDTFHVRLALDQTFQQIVADSIITAHALQVQALQNHTTYYWSVRVENDETTSDWSPTLKFTTREEAEQSPVDEQITFGNTSGSNSGNGGSNKNFNSNDYLLVGIPGRDVTEIKDLFSGRAGKDWKVFKDNGAQKDFLAEYSNDTPLAFGPGKGFWVLSKDPIRIKKDISSVAISKNDTYDIPLHPGWNIISNPFTQPVNWKQVKAFNKMSSFLYGYRGSFFKSDKMQPFQGYYLYNDSDSADTLKIPYTTLQKRQEKQGQKAKKENVPAKIQLTINKVKADLTTSVSMVYTENAQTSKANNHYSPPLELSRFGAAIISQQNTHRKKYLRTSGEVFNHDTHHYIVEVKSDAHSKIRWTPHIEGMGHGMGVLIVEPESGRTKVLSNGQTYSLIPRKGQEKFEIYTGNVQRLNKVKDRLIPHDFKLEQNYPNPFNPTTTIRFGLDTKSHVRLEIFDVLGRKVKTLVNGTRPSGWYTLKFDGSHLASGIYFYRIIMGQKVKTRKMLLIK